MERCPQTNLYFRSKHDTSKVHVGVKPKDYDAGVKKWESMGPEHYETPPKAAKAAAPLYSQPEQDWDAIYHKDNEKLIPFLVQLRADNKADTEARVVYSEPEKDEDEVYHRDNQYSEIQTESEQKMREDSAVRVHLQPEVDKDDLYHKDVGQLFQSDPKVAAPVGLPARRKHSEPEEDLDDLYHQWSLRNNHFDLTAADLV